METWNTLAEQFADDSRVLSEVAALLESEGQYEPAIDLWNQIRSLAKNDPSLMVDADLRIANIYQKQEKPNQAINLLGKTLDRLDPDSWRAQHVYQQIERSILESSQPEDLTRFWQARLKNDPESLAAMVQLSRSHKIAGDLDAAILQLESAIVKAPRSRSIREILIRYLQEKQKYTQAIKHAETLASLYPQDPEVWLQFGHLQLDDPRLDRHEAQKSAVAAWHHIAEIRSNDPVFAVEAAKACCAPIDSSPWDANGKPRVLTEQVLSENKPLLSAAERHYREAARRNPKSAQYRRVPWCVFILDWKAGRCA